MKVGGNVKRELSGGGWFVRGHCCLVPAASLSAAAARWRGGPPPGARIRAEPLSDALNAHISPSSNKQPSTSAPTNAPSPSGDESREDAERSTSEVTGQHPLKAYAPGLRYVNHLRYNIESY
ncbi:unnamed protein product, partial [Iphiclides podalirius]